MRFQVVQAGLRPERFGVARCRLGTGGGLPKLAYNARMAMIGDSIAKAEANSTTTQSFIGIGSVPDWANAFQGSPLFVPKGANKGIGGQRIETIQARFTTELASIGASIIFADGGINDVTDRTSEQIIAAWDSMIAQAGAMKARLVILPILPSSLHTAAGPTAVRNAVNAALLARQSPTVRVLDTSGYDYTTMAYAEIIGDVGARIHPNVIGAQLLAQSMRSIISEWVEPGSPLMEAGDPNNLINDLGQLIGTGGSLSGATGVVATGWGVTVTGGATVVCSQPNRAKGGKWCELTISGSVTGTNRTITLSTGSYNFSAKGVTAGQLIEVVGDVEFEGSAQNIDGIRMFSQIQNSSFQQLANCSCLATVSAVGSGFATPGQFSAAFRMPPYAREAGAGDPGSGTTPNRLVISPVVAFRDGTGLPVSAKIRIGGLGARVVS